MGQNRGCDVHPNALSDLTGDVGVESLGHFSYLGFSCISSPLLGPPVSPSLDPAELPSCVLYLRLTSCPITLLDYFHLFLTIELKWHSGSFSGASTLLGP